MAPFLYWNFVSKPKLKLERRREKRKYSTLYAPLKLKEQRFLRILFYPLHMIRLLVVAVALVFFSGFPLVQALALSVTSLF